MAFCRLLGTEPYVAVNSGAGESASAARQVEYCNGPVDSEMGRLRAENGHPGTDPWMDRTLRDRTASQLMVDD